MKLIKKIVRQVCHWQRCAGLVPHRGAGRRQSPQLSQGAWHHLHPHRQTGYEGGFQQIWFYLWHGWGEYERFKSTQAQGLQGAGSASRWIRPRKTADHWRPILRPLRGLCDGVRPMRAMLRGSAQWTDQELNTRAAHLGLATSHTSVNSTSLLLQWMLPFWFNFI